MLQIRPYVREDGEQVVSWFEDEVTFRKWSADQYDSYPVTANQLNERYDSVMTDGKFLVFTAVDFDKVVGHFTIRFVEEENKVGRFGFIVMNPAFRGKGYGRQMLSLGLRYAFEDLQLDKVTIGVFENNMPARRCYEKSGFHTNMQGHPKVYELCGEKWMCLELSMTRTEWKERTQ